MRSLAFPALAAIALAIGACDRPAGPQPAASASAAAAPRERVVCLDLPGAVRTALSLGVDGKHLFYAERVVDGDRDRYDLVSLELGTRRTEVLVRDVGTDPERAGDRVVFRRPMAPPERSVAFPGRAMEDTPARLWSAVPGRGEPVALSPEGARVTSFTADPKGGTVYYTARERGAGRSSIWKVPAAGGAPEKLALGAAVFGFADGGKSLVATIFRDKAVLAKIPIAGGNPPWTADTGFNVAVTDTSVVLLGGPADKRMVQVLSLADGKATVAEGAVLGDLPLVAGVPGFVMRDEGRGPLMRVDGAKVVPVVTVTGGTVHAAAPLPDGTLAALVALDTNDDGQTDTVTVEASDDERDVCLLLPQSAGDEAPRAVPSRTTPKRHAAALPKIKKLLEEKEPELAGGKLRFLASGRLLVIEVAGAGPADPEALRDRLKALQKGVAEVSADPKLGVSIRFADSGRHATSLWSEDRGRLGTWIGVGDFVLADRAAAAVEYTVDYPQRMHVELAGEARRVDADVACAGKVKNLGGEPVDLQVECRAYSPYVFQSEPWTAERGPTKPPSLAPNASGAYEVKLPTLIDGSARPGVRFLVNGKLVEAIDTKQHDHDKDWIAALERIRADTGAAPVTDRPYTARTLQSESHPLAAFREPQGFAEMPPKKQEALAKALWKGVLAHYTKQHGGQQPTVSLYDAQGKRTYTVDNGKLAKP